LHVSQLRGKNIRITLWLVVCVGSLISLLVLPSYASRSQALPAALPEYISEYSVPTPTSAPLAITTDANGMVWFTESNASKLARFDPVDQSFAEYRVPGVGDMWGVTLDHNGNIWLTQYSGKGSVSPGGSVVFGGTGRLVRFDPIRNNFTIIEVPTVGSFPMRLVVDDQNKIWFTELLGNKIGVYDQSKQQLTEYPVPTNASGPADLTFDTRGALWFTEAYARNLGEFFPWNQSFTEYPLGNASASQIVSSPVGLAIDNQGNIWVADHGGNWIVKFNPVTHGIAKYPTHFPPQDVYPISLVNDLLIDSNGRVWFAEHAGNSIGYLNTQDYSMTEFPIPTGPISTCLWLALTPNGDVWFTEWSSNKIGVVHSNASIPVAVLVSDDYLRLSPGDETTLSMLTRTSQNTVGNGTLNYSWSSYNPNDVSVQFSPQYPSLAGPADTNAQAELFISTTAKPGNYTLALGIETARVSVWRMIQVQVTAQTPTTAIGTTFILFSMAAVILAVIVIVLVLVLRGKRERRAADDITPEKA
jgi:virginiamycin B lyase